MIGDIIKYLIVYRLLTSPQAETAILCIALLLFLFFGAFVKLKNGWLSWVAYFILIGIPISLLTINLININLPVEDLKLSDTKKESYIDINGDGIVVRRALRRGVTLPLLVIRELTDPRRIEDLASFIDNHYDNKLVYYKTSKKYPGIVLVDEFGNDLNLELINNGYVKISEKAPSQYLTAASNARNRGVGIWATTVGMQPTTMFKCTFYIICFMLGYLLMDRYQKLKKSALVISVKLKPLEEIYEKIKNNDGSGKGGTSTGDKGGTSDREDSDGGDDSGGGTGTGT